MNQMFPPRFCLKCMGFLVAFLCLLAAPLAAQFSSGFEGTVTDPSGASVAGAEVTVTDLSTGVPQKTKTSESGTFRVQRLSPGTYRAEVAAPGFKTWTTDNIILDANQIRTLNASLVVGEQKSTVEVTAEAAAVETGKSTVGRAIETKTVETAPLIGRNIYAGVAYLAPGVTGGGNAFGGAGGSGSQGTNSFAQEQAFQINAAGQRQEANEYDVDGSSVNGNSRDGIVNLTPEPDTVAEVKVSAQVFSAEKGRESGTLIEVYTKSGTNKLHGTLSEFHTNNDLTSRTVFQDNVPVFRKNEFGGTLGGPIIKDKTFFFVSAFQLLSAQAITQTVSVETPAFRQYIIGNFPNNLSAQFFQRAPALGTPGSGFLTVAQIENALPSPIPPPSLPGDLVAVGTVSINQSPQLNARQWNVRIDHNFNGYKDKLFFNNFRTTSDAAVADPRPLYTYVSPNTGRYDKLNWTHAFKPTLLNEASFTYVRADGSNPGAPKGRDLPNVNITGIGDSFNQWGPAGWVHNNFNWHDAASYVRGSHNIRFGIDVDRQQDLDNFTNGLIRPAFGFANILDFANDKPFSQGNVTIDVANGHVATNLYQRIFMLYAGSYIQDDWKLSRTFTLNLGLRWDYFGHLASNQNGSVPFAWFTPGTGSSEQAAIANGFMQVRPNGFLTKDAVRGFVPRFGFGWDVFGNGSTAVRGGYGIYRDRIANGSFMFANRANPPQYATPTVTVQDPTPPQFTYQTGNADGSGFPPPGGIQYQVDSHGGLLGTRTLVSGQDPNLKVPFVQNWSLSIQRRVTNTITVEGDYLGSYSDHLYVTTDVNRFAGDLIINHGTLIRLNPSFGQVLYGRSIGTSDANYGSFMLSKRFSSRWSIRGIYTFGKAIDETSSNGNGVPGALNVFDAFNVRAQRGRSDFNVAKRFTMDSVLDVPSPFSSGLGSRILGGWTLSTILILQSGQPFSVYSSASYPAADFNGDGFNYDAPNTPTFGNYLATSRSDYIRGLFTPSRFPLPAPGQEGDLGRNTFDGPGLANVNLNVQKSFHIPWFVSEGAQVQLRGEIFNLFNRVNLVNPISDLSDPLFGKSTDQNLPRQVNLGVRIQF
ncbi:MAG: carboxypeptidase regulatory-like domain-containing protein [Bryobacteraceae bacterium]